jgi:hypothetical protein
MEPRLGTCSTTLMHQPTLDALNTPLNRPLDAT